MIHNNSFAGADMIYRDRVLNSIHTTGAFSAKEFLLQGYRIHEDLDFKERRNFTAQIVSPTLGYFQRLFQDLNEVLHWSSVGIENLDDRTKETLKKSEFNTWICSVLLPRLLDNPNAFWCLFPILNVNNEVSFISKIVNFDKVKQISKDEIHVTIENDKTLKNGTYIITNNSVYLKDSEDDYFVNLESQPIKKRLFGQLGGEIGYEDLNNSKELYLSFIQGAFNVANEIFLLSLDSELSRQQFAHLMMVAKAKSCRNCDGTKFVYTDLEDENKPVTCGVCSGTGEESISYRLGDVLTFPEVEIGSIDEREKRLSEKVKDAITFVEPPLEPLKFSYENIEKLKLELEKQLSMVTSKSFMQSADAQEQQWKGRYNLCDKIGERLWFVIGDMLQAMQDVLLLSSPEIQIITPDSFIEESIDEIRNNLVLLRETFAPESEVIDEYLRLYKKIYADNPNELRKQIFIVQNDYLALKKDDSDKQIASATDKDFQYSVQLPSILSRISDFDNNPEFANWTDEQIKTEIDKVFVFVEPPAITDGTEFNDF